MHKQGSATNYAKVTYVESDCKHGIVMLGMCFIIWFCIISFCIGQIGDILDQHKSTCNVTPQVYGYWTPSGMAINHIQRIAELSHIKCHTAPLGPLLLPVAHFTNMN